MYELIDSEPSVVESMVYWVRQGVLFSKDTSVFRCDVLDDPNETFSTGEVAPAFQHKAKVIPVSIFVSFEDSPSDSLIAYAESTVQGEGLTLVIDIGSNFIHWPKESYTAFLELPLCNTQEEKLNKIHQVISGLDNAFQNAGMWCMDYSDIAPIFSDSVHIKVRFLDIELDDPSMFSIDSLNGDGGGVNLAIGTSPLNTLGEFEDMLERLESGFGDHHVIFNQYHQPGQTGYELLCFSG